jgi:hypothetical protein
MNSLNVSSTASEVKVAFFVAITVIPARLPRLGQTVLSFANQRYPPHRILVSAPRQFTRFPGQTANLSLVKAQLRRSNDRSAELALSLLETHVCDHDDGPGTKLLCVLERLRNLAHMQPLGITSVAVLADDDREYKPTALHLLERAMHHSPIGAYAFSYSTYTLPGTPITIGQGADLFAMPVSALATRGAMRTYYSLCRSVDERFYFHDDVYISLFLADVRGVAVRNVVSTLLEFDLVGKVSHTDRIQFVGPVHGRPGSATWNTALRRLGHNLTRTALTQKMGRLRPQLQRAARDAGFILYTDRTADGPNSSSFGQNYIAASNELLRLYSHVTARAPTSVPMAMGGTVAEEPPTVAVAAADAATGGTTRAAFAKAKGREVDGSTKPTKLLEVDPDRAALWLAEACPFEETRHSCFFFGQHGSRRIEEWAAARLAAVDPVAPDAALYALAGHTLHFVGDSVLRQLAHALMCRLQSRLLKDKLVWRNPMQRRRAKARPHCSHNCHSVWFLDVPDYSS